MHKICLVTGGNRGIGKAIVEGLAKEGHTVIFTSRDVYKGEETRREIMKRTGNEKIIVEYMDLEHADTIDSIATKLGRRFEKLDVLINNAATFQPVYKETYEGIELQLAVNYFGTVLVTEKLKPLLVLSGNGRVINSASNLHRIGRLRFNTDYGSRLYNPVTSYAETKLAVMMYTYEAARRWKDSKVTMNCYFPGAIGTDIANKSFYGFFWKAARPFMDNCGVGARTALFLVLSPTCEGITGQYFAKQKIRTSSSLSHSHELSAKLWEWTQDIISKRYG